MSLKLIARLGTVAAVLSMTVAAAQAAAVNAASATFSGDIITFDSYDGLLIDATNGNPSAGLLLDPGSSVRLQSDPGTVVGANAQDLGFNGLWGARFAPTPTGEGNFVAAFAPIVFNFGAAGPQAQVGAYFNLFQNDVKTNTLTLTAYDANQVALESFSVALDTDVNGYNEGRFLGFSRASADIHSVGISGGTFVSDNLTFTASAVPEPGALALMVAGLGALGAARRRSK